MAQSSERLRSIIESMLLVSAEPLPAARIVEVIQGEDPDIGANEIKDALAELLKTYGDAERPLARGIRVEELGAGYQLRTTAENAGYVRRLLAARPQRLTKAALETLAIIAYRQPVTKPEVETIRGVDVGAVMKALLDRDLVRILGKKEEVGRPILYGTTKNFLELFGLKSLSALPTLREYHELDPAHQQEVDQLYEEDRKPLLSDLAATAELLVDRGHDPTLDDLDKAVLEADAVDRATRAVLDPGAEPEADGAVSPPDAPVDGAMPAEAEVPLAPVEAPTTEPEPEPEPAPKPKKPRKKAAEPVAAAEQAPEPPPEKPPPKIKIRRKPREDQASASQLAFDTSPPPASPDPPAEAAAESGEGDPRADEPS